MDTLDASEWDVVIAGTGFAQSLLALSLSRAGLKVLHVDENDYYGGNEAALSLAEAEKWAERFESNEPFSTFSHATISKQETEDAAQQRLSSSRAYSVALAPHLIYARSNLISALVSSRTHNQLDFQAVGSWFVLGSTGASEEQQIQLTKVPNGREDVFQDTLLKLRTKRNLMKFLRFVGTYEDHREEWEDSQDLAFAEFLETKFALPAESYGPILALTLSPQPDRATTTNYAIPRIARHLRSIGVFGPGFGAVLPKWGGLAEISQVACRACAVGGGVYVLGKGIKSHENPENNGPMSLELSDGEKVTTKWLAGDTQDINGQPQGDAPYEDSEIVSKSISIISSPLESLFSPTSEGGVKPAGAVVVVPSSDDSQPPVHIFAHSSEAGECPSTQCILYASVTESFSKGRPRLDQAVVRLLQSFGDVSTPVVLWSMVYQQQASKNSEIVFEKNMILLPRLSADLALDDSVLGNVKKAWAEITAGEEDEFMTFDSREGIEDDGDDM